MQIKLVMLVFGMLMAGCTSGTPEGGGGAQDAVYRRVYEIGADETGAMAGDPVAQFALGESYCCTVDSKPASLTFVMKDNTRNELASEWLCRSARQGYGPAQYQLARIYSGRPFEHGTSHDAADLVVGAPTNRSIALMWARLAQRRSVANAGELVTAIMREASVADADYALQLLKTWTLAPCTWSEVIGVTT